MTYRGGHTPNRHNAMAMKRKNYYLPEQLLKKMARRMKLEGLSASELVRRALDAYLKS